MTWTQNASPKVAAILQELRTTDPDRLDATLRLASMNGWKNATLARALGVTREAVRARLSRWGTSLSGAIDLPLPPKPPQKLPPPPKVDRLLVREEIAEQLRAMHAIARTVNGATPVDDRRREVSIELTSALAKLKEQGVTSYRLAKILGVQITAIEMRLARHGYRPVYPSQPKPYLGTPTPRRTHCKRGHPLDDDNVYIRSGNRSCKKCTKARVRDYYQRRKAAELAGEAS